MALHENRIAGFSFIALHGELQPPAFQIATDDRPGVDGSEFTLVGKKGRPFSVFTQVDVADYAGAKSKFMGYRQLIEFDAVELVQGGVSTLLENYKVKVLDVIPRRLGTIRGASGYRIDATSQGWCECEWVLQAIELT
jgi:hypothetical protein